MCICMYVYACMYVYIHIYIYTFIVFLRLERAMLPQIFFNHKVVSTQMVEAIFNTKWPQSLLLMEPFLIATSFPAAYGVQFRRAGFWLTHFLLILGLFVAVLNQQWQ